MAVTRSSFWQLLHFFARFLGVTGAAAALVGWYIYEVLGTPEKPQETLVRAGLIVLIAGLSGIALALIAEVRSIGRMTGSRRGAFGLNVVVQISLALAFVAGANYYAFHRYQRFDLTSDQRFTLDESLRSQLAKLQDETHIIVYQNYVSFGQRGKSDQDVEALRAKNQQDKIDFAAQRKIVEKVKDLAEQFQDLGPRFHVHILDLKDESYDAKLTELRNLSPELADTIIAARENSVFFFSKPKPDESQSSAKSKVKIQRLGFNDIYRIDTKASVDGANLVLQYQGEKPFVDKILNIEEKKPRVATAIIHPLLGFHDKADADLTMIGAKKIYDEYGFESKDIMLRKLGPRRGLTQQPTALTYDESRFEQIEDTLAGIEKVTTVKTKELEEATTLHKFWKDSTLAQLNKKYVYFFRQDGAQGVTLRSNIDAFKKSPIQFKFIDVDEDDQKSHVSTFQRVAEAAKDTLDKAVKKKDELLKEKTGLKVEDLAEKRRMTDIEARMKRMLADVDLLIVPRLTILNAAQGMVIQTRVHRMDSAHLNAIKHFAAQGKPILFLIGPGNEPREAPDSEASDELDGLIGELGFKMPRQTILYDAEIEEFNERKRDDPFSRNETEYKVPGLDLDDTTSTVTWMKKKDATPLTPHPVRSSMRMVARTINEQAGNEIRIRNPRPVYFVRTELEPKPAATILGALALPGFSGPVLAAAAWMDSARYVHNDSAVFLVTRKEGWNEENPFIIDDDKIPSFTPTKDDDRKKGTLEEVRRGPFPIGVAVETTAPTTWAEKDAKPKKTRIAVIGSGGTFVGPELTPVQGKMLVDVSNWLLGRDDLLAKDAETWSFPRVPVASGSTDYKLWLALAGGLPLFFIYVGTVVWMTRRLR